MGTRSTVVPNDCGHRARDRLCCGGSGCSGCLPVVQALSRSSAVSTSNLSLALGPVPSRITSSRECSYTKPLDVPIAAASSWASTSCVMRLRVAAVRPWRRLARQSTQPLKLNGLLSLPATRAVETQPSSRRELQLTQPPHSVHAWPASTASTSPRSRKTSRSACFTARDPRGVTNRRSSANTNRPSGTSRSTTEASNANHRRNCPSDHSAACGWLITQSHANLTNELISGIPRVSSGSFHLGAQVVLAGWESASWSLELAPLLVLGTLNPLAAVESLCSCGRGYTAGTHSWLRPRLFRLSEEFGDRVLSQPASAGVPPILSISDQLDELVVPLRELVRRSCRRLDPLPRPAASLPSQLEPFAPSDQPTQLPAIARASTASAAHSAAERLKGHATRPVASARASRP